MCITISKKRVWDCGKKEQGRWEKKEVVVKAMKMIIIFIIITGIMIIC